MRRALTRLLFPFVMLSLLMLIASYFAAKAVYDVTVAIDGGADRPSFAVFVKHYLQE